MPTHHLPWLPPALSALSPDGWLLFATRTVRMFAYGFLAVVLALYLSSLGFSERQIGLLLTLALLGDTALSLWLTMSADRLGRRRMLVIGAMLMALAGGVFAMTSDFLWLIVAATIGVISPSGSEVGPFLSIEQAALAQTLRKEDRTAVFAWYNLVGSVATALGSLAGGWMSEYYYATGASGSAVYRPIVLGYAALGVVLAVGFLGLSSAAEASPEPATGHRTWLGLHRSRRVVAQLASLFALDAFGGGFIVQSLVAYWFHVRFGADPAQLGTIFFGANLLAAASALAASSLAQRFGLLNTMVFTHLPSNILLLLVPLMPNLSLAILVLLARYSISQMDVPTRQSYTMAVVDPDERSAAAGITNVARSIGAALAPLIAGVLLAEHGLSGAPFFLAGGIKIVYDVWLYRAFRNVRGDA